MVADTALRCECGYEVQASDEAARVDEVRRHASETHGIDLSADVALNVVRRVTARAEQRTVNLGGAINNAAAETRPSLSWDAQTPGSADPNRRDHNEKEALT
jgi:predicted small metal-binding protein